VWPRKLRTASWIVRIGALEPAGVCGMVDAVAVQPLNGRVALVTGVSRQAGIGFAIARRLVADGAAVFAQGWTPHDDAQAWGSDADGPDAVRALGERARYAEADFADPDTPRGVFAAARGAFGHVDILVANHARSGHGRLAETTAADLDAFLHENVRASILLVKELAAQHDGRPGGRVVLMTSGQHLAPMAREVAYAVSKGALHQATKTLADELIDRGITVNAVNPGPTDTGWEIAGADPSPAMPLGRWGAPDDAARLVAWLCSDEAAWITGQVIDSEGGFRR
jgi:NAD(P)-dependent dehydrogenase (short-subunit alcohol dehydrogenase family)